MKKKNLKKYLLIMAACMCMAGCDGKDADEADESKAKTEQSTDQEENKEADKIEKINEKLGTSANKASDAEWSAEAAEKYIKVEMDLYYHNDTTQYVTAGHTAQQAADGRANELEFSGYNIMYLCGVDSEWISDDRIEKYTKVTEKVLNRSTYVISDVEVDPETGIGQFTITYTPCDFWTLTDEAYDTQVMNLYEIYPDFDVESSSDDEYEEAMNTFADLMLEVVDMPEKDYPVMAESYSKTYPIDFNNGIVTSETWDDISINMIGYITEE